MLIALMLGALLGYYWTGFDMVFYHHHCVPMDRPAYVRGPLLFKALCGMGWPYVCWRNEELGWFASCFLGSGVVIALTVLLLAKIWGYFATIFTVGLIRTIRVPVISAAYTKLVVIASAIFWILLSKVFRMQVSGAIERSSQYGRK